MANLPPPPRQDKELTGHSWQDWFYKLWNKITVRYIQTTGNISKGSSAPLQVYYNNGNINITGWQMKVGDSIYFAFVMPQEYVLGSDITFEFHYYSTNITASRYIAGTLYWSVSSANEVLSTLSRNGNLPTGDILLPTVSMTFQEKAFTLSGSTLNAKPGDHIFLYFIRTASVGTAPTSPADDPVFLHLEAQIQTYQHRI